MSLEGVIVNGQVELESPAGIPDGTRVRVEPIAPLIPPDLRSNWLEAARKERADKSPTELSNVLRSIAGTVHDLPTDFAAQHDHYIHGTPKR